MFTIPDLIFYGETAGDELGYICRGVGDLNQDNYMDFIISAPGDDAAGTDRGLINIYFGGSELKSVPDLVLPGHYNGQFFGKKDICGGGDLNNDGYPDIVTSDNLFSTGSTTKDGRLYIYYGGNPMDSIVDVILTGRSPGTPPFWW